MKRLHVVGMDQLNLDLHPKDAALVFLESYAELRRRPYHKTRIAFLLTNYRHFAAECEESGRDVHYLKTQKPIHEALNELEPSQLTMVEPAERELLQSLDDLISSGAPVTRLYWNFLSRNQDSLADNPRLRPVIYGLKKRKGADLSKDQAVFEWATNTLQAGGLLKPEEMPEGKS